MSLPIISAEDRLKERHSAKVCLVGVPGVGKTSQLKTLPAVSTLFVDLEAGDLSVKDWAGDAVRPRSWPEFRDLVVFLARPMPTTTPEQAFCRRITTMSVASMVIQPNWRNTTPILWTA